MSTCTSDVADITLVKEGETRDVKWTVNRSLVGCTVVLLSRPYGFQTPVTVLAATITNAGTGEVTHTLTGTLPKGDHEIELVITDGAGVVSKSPTVPGTVVLRVGDDVESGL